jgi:hypothetical protein
VNLHHSQSLSRKSHLAYVSNADGARAHLNATQSTRLGRPESGSVSVFTKYSTAADVSILLKSHRVCTEFLLNLLRPAHLMILDAFWVNFVPRKLVVTHVMRITLFPPLWCSGCLTCPFVATGSPADLACAQLTSRRNADSVKLSCSQRAVSAYRLQIYIVGWLIVCRKKT